MSLRVLHFLPSLRPEAGSPAVAVRGLIAALDDRGVSSRVACVTDVERAPSADSFDVAHAHGLDPEPCREVARWVSRLAKPLVVSPLGRGDCPQRERNGGLRRWLTRRGAYRVLGRAAAVLAVGETEFSQLQSIVPSERLHTVAYGCRSDERDLPSEPMPGSRPASGEHELLYLGPIHPEEGLVPLLRAVAELGHDFLGWKLVLAGAEPGDWRAKLEAALERRRAMDRVTFVTDPGLSEQDEVLARASVFVAPSPQPRCPISVMQAAAASIPTVATAHVVPPELGPSLRVCQANRESLRDALRPLIACDDARRAEMGRAVRSACRKHLDWATRVEDFLAVYQAVAGLTTVRRRGPMMSSGA